jgi:hypothetical protein
MTFGELYSLPPRRLLWITKRFFEMADYVEMTKGKGDK